MGPAADDYDFRYALTPYTKSIQIYVCPSNPTNTADLNDYNPSWAGTAIIKRSYAANGGAGDGSYGGKRPLQDDVPGTHMAEIVSPAMVIMIGEAYDRAHPDYWDNPNDMRMWGHMSQTNWLFCDGHVKLIKPANTVQPTNMWNITNAAAPANLIGWCSANPNQPAF